MPISEQALLSQHNQLNTEQIQTAFTTLNITSPEFKDSDANTLLLHFLASAEETSNKMSLVKHLFGVEEESKTALLQIMTLILKSHWSKLEFNNCFDNGEEISYIKSPAVSENVVAICRLALYLAGKQQRSLPIIETLLHITYAHTLDITQRKEAVKIIQQTDLSPYAHLINSDLLGSFTATADELLLGTPIDHLFAALEPLGEKFSYSLYMILYYKIIDEDIFITVDEKTKSIAFTHQNQKHSFEIKSDDTWMRLQLSSHDRLHHQSRFRPILPADHFALLAKSIRYRHGIHTIECMNMLKTFPVDQLKQLAVRFKESTDLRKMINNELRSRQVNDSVTQLKHEFKFFPFLEKYHREHPKRSLDWEKIRDDLARDYQHIELPGPQQAVINDALEYVQTRDLIFRTLMENQFKTTKAKFQSQQAQNNEDVKQEHTQPLQNRLQALSSQFLKGMMALTINELITLNQRLAPYPEIRKGLKNMGVIKHLEEEKVAKEIKALPLETRILLRNHLDANKSLSEFCTISTHVSSESSLTKRIKEELIKVTPSSGIAACDDDGFEDVVERCSM